MERYGIGILPPRSVFILLQRKTTKSTQWIIEQMQSNLLQQEKISRYNIIIWR